MSELSSGNIPGSDVQDTRRPSLMGPIGWQWWGSTKRVGVLKLKARGRLPAVKELSQEDDAVWTRVHGNAS